MRRLIMLCFAFLTLFSSYAVQADPAFVQRKDVQQFINKMVKQHGFNKKELTQIMSDVQLQPQIIELFNSEDAKEGVQSFLERRDGNFSGK